MTFSADRVYALDIETSTERIVGPESQPGIADYNPGLDPILGFVTEIVVATDDKDLDAVFQGGDRDGEWDILDALDGHLLNLAPGLISTWNGCGFDIPFLATRYDEHHLDVAAHGPEIFHLDHLKPKYDAIAGHGPEARSLIDGESGHSGIYGMVWKRNTAAFRPTVPHQHLDVSFAYKTFAEKHGVKWSLKPVCIALGIPMIEVNREEMHLLTAEERHAYVMSDGNGTRLLALNLLGHIDLGTGSMA